MRKLSELPGDSIFRIIHERSNTVFSGSLIEKAKYRSERQIVETDTGDKVLHSQDHVQTVEKKDKIIGIIAADASDSNINVDHPYWYLPHLSAIYVKAAYRHQGIATRLIAEFLEEVERSRIVADYNPSLEEFYNQLDAEVIQLGQFKHRIDL